MTQANTANTTARKRRYSAGLQLPYTHLLGDADSREQLPTPSLLVDEEALGRNIARMAQFTRQAGLKLRPHIKTHKCSQIARLQLAAGAVGISCATLDEAEAMADAGITGILLTSTIVTQDKLERYLRLLRQAPDTLLVLDHPEPVSRLSALAQAAGLQAGVLIDLDIGYHRSGVRTEEQAGAVVRAIQDSPALKLLGVQAYSGAIQHIAGLDQRKAVLTEQMGALSRLLAHIQASTGQLPICSGGGTGTHALDAQQGIFTELQAGSYVFMDADYARIDLGEPPFETSLRLRASVVSVNCDDLDGDERFVILDSGTKSFALNGPAPVCLTAPWENASFRFMGDEHAHLILAPGSAPPRIGTGLEFQVSHCDPTVHHFDHLYVVRGETLTDIWPIDARGRS